MSPLWLSPCSYMLLCVRMLLVMIMYAVCNAVSRGAFALFAETSSKTVDAVSSFSRTLAIPLVTSSGPVSATSSLDGRRREDDDDASVVSPSHVTGYVVFMRPPYHRALADVIEYYKWPRVYYMYDNSEGTIHRSINYTITLSEVINIQFVVMF